MCKHPYTSHPRRAVTVTVTVTGGSVHWQNIIKLQLRRGYGAGALGLTAAHQQAHWHSESESPAGYRD
jgi:hypothetical protein